MTQPLHPTDRLTASTINDEQLEALYQRAEDAEAERVRWLAFIERGMDTHMQFSVLRPDGTTEQLPCADWCYACRIERADTVIGRVQALAKEYPVWISTPLLDAALDTAVPREA
ncbi:hypothetical protein ACFRIC_09195 [Streptomyces sp. NPDC056738]|uniref:hypothetical protein n=1 Tax=Streptomyces sp. NPDC056738 TaxID=3345933 RepID=UPI0036815BD1